MAEIFINKAICKLPVIRYLFYVVICRVRYDDDYTKVPFDIQDSDAI